MWMQKVDMPQVYEWGSSRGFAVRLMKPLYMQYDKTDNWYGLPFLFAFHLFYIIIVLCRCQDASKTSF